VLKVSVLVSNFYQIDSEVEVRKLIYS